MTATQVDAAAVLVEPRRFTRRGPRLGTWLPPLIVFAIFIGLWYVARLLIPVPALLPPPHIVFLQLFDPDTAMEITQALALSAGVAAGGLIAAIIIGMAWAVIMSQAKWAENALFPYAVFLQCIPILAITPLISFLFGFGYPARMLVCVLIALFPIVSNTLFGLQSVDRQQRELFRLQGATRWTVLTKLQFPAASPAIFAGLRISAGLAVVGALVGDFFFQRGQPGLGSLISQYQATLQSPQLYAAIVVAALFGVVVFRLFGWLGRLATGKWYDGA